MTPPSIDGATPHRAQAAASLGSSPAIRAAAQARARELADQFTAQIQASMLESLNAMNAESDEPSGGGEEEGSSDAGFEGLAQLQAGAGANFATAGLGAGAITGAGAGSEATLAKQLLAALDTAHGIAPTAATANLGSTTTGAVSSSARDNAVVVAQVAREQGVDPVAAVAMMLVESGGNNRAVGDGGTSFGLFQLHVGGMLTAAGLSKDQAFDPHTNAAVSLKSLAHEQRKGPNRSAGTIAAASQRPADPAGYARKVDAMMGRARQLLGA